MSGIAGSIYFATQKLRNFATTVQVLVIGVPSIDFLKFFTGVIPITQKFKINNHSQLKQKVDSISATLYHLKPNGKFVSIAGSTPTNGFTIQPNSSNPFAITFEAPVLSLPKSAAFDPSQRVFKAVVNINIGGQIFTEELKL